MANREFCKFVDHTAVHCAPSFRCDKCGWNPAVARKRTARIREELRKRTAPWFIGNGTFEYVQQSPKRK